MTRVQHQRKSARLGSAKQRFGAPELSPGKGSSRGAHDEVLRSLTLLERHLAESCLSGGAGFGGEHSIRTPKKPSIATSNFHSIENVRDM